MIGPGCRRQRRRAARGAGRRRRAGVARARPAWCAPAARRSRPTRPVWSPASPTPPGPSCRWPARSTRPGCWTRPLGCCGSSLAELSELALSADPGAGGLVLVPYLEGERTPNLPLCHRRAARHDAGQSRRRPTWPGPRSRVCCADSRPAWMRWWNRGFRCPDVRLIGGAAQSEAVRRIAPTVFGLPVRCPRPGSTSPTARPGRPPGCCAAPSSRRPGRSARSRPIEGAPHGRPAGALRRSCEPGIVNR